MKSLLLVGGGAATLESLRNLDLRRRGKLFSARLFSFPKSQGGAGISLPPLDMVHCTLRGQRLAE